MSEEREKDNSVEEKSWFQKSLDTVTGFFDKGIDFVKKFIRRRVEKAMGRDFLKKSSEPVHNISQNSVNHHTSTSSSNTDTTPPNSSIATSTHEGKSSHEKKETVSELLLKVAEECESPGPYIGISREKREALGIANNTSEKNTVEVFDQSGKSLGVFLVGKLKKEFLDRGENICTANVDDRYKEQTLTIKKTEKKIETKEQLEVTSKGPCESKGNYVGLSEYHRVQLDVKVGDTIEVLSRGQHKGLYTVGEIPEEILNNKERSVSYITANNIDIDSTIILQKPKEYMTTLAVEHGVENKESVKKPNKDGKTRDQIIQERFGQDAAIDTRAYITIPNALVHGLGYVPMNDNGNFHNITKSKVQIGDQPPQEMIVVPTGEKVGFTEAAETKLGLIGRDTKKAQVKVRDGIVQLDLAV